jgi:hypothetical protein
MSDSLLIIFGVVPEAMSEWNPEMAPQAMVMKANGNKVPGMMGPPPAANSVNAGIFIVGFTIVTPITRKATVPTFMYALR